ncbi:MAG: sugar phosphate isomerase/epimerase [Clostridiales bacterium]|nr:sugar phosphate isomerase/epimerase [Clostridiales bacterium]
MKKEINVLEYKGMKKGINLYFNTCFDYETKLKLIKKYGYDEVFVGLEEDREKDFKKLAGLIKDYGFKLTMVHCRYDETILNNFWKDNEIGEQITNSFIEQINICGKYTKNFVAHLHANQDTKQSEIGIERLKRILKECEKYDINFAVENLYLKSELEYIFNNISHPLLKICYDVGHLNWSKPKYDMIEEFGKYISVVHLHDNDGMSDLHNILGTGTIDVEFLANRFKSFSEKIVLSSEIKYSQPDKPLMEIHLKENFEALKRLEKLIKK